MTEPITAQMLEGALVFQEAHYHKGHHPDGSKIGFAYGHRFNNFPRLKFIDHVWYETPLDRYLREWYVDGVMVADQDAAVAALNIPVVLTAEEAVALFYVTQHLTDLRLVENEIALSVAINQDCPENSPDENFVVAGSPRAQAMALMHSLRDKGQIAYSRGKVRRVDDKTPRND